MSDMVVPQNETINCPFCNKGKIDITIIPEHYSYHSARAFGKVKKIPVVHPEHIEIHFKCPKCGKSKKELKEVIEKGTIKQLSHEERLKRLRESGLPTQIES